MSLPGQRLDVDLSELEISNFYFFNFIYLLYEFLLIYENHKILKKSLPLAELKKQENFPNYYDRRPFF